MFLCSLQEGIDITNPEYYSKITREQLQSIMRGDNEVQIPLFEERLIVLHEVGAALLSKYNGTFVNCLKKANKSAAKLLDIIVTDFPCFRDVATYNGLKVNRNLNYVTDIIRILVYLYES